jgi:hypothetical protein
MIRTIEEELGDSEEEGERKETTSTDKWVQNTKIFLVIPVKYHSDRPIGLYNRK